VTPGGARAANAGFVEAVRAALARTEGTPPRIESLERAAFAECSSYRIDVVTLRTAGRVERILLKDFGACKHRKDRMEERRVRELRVYREILATARLGTPAYRGSVWDETHQRFWLLLEYVGGRRLSDLGFDYWLAAARWLGRLQRYAGAESPSTRTFLVEHGSMFFWSVAEEAQRAVRVAAPALGPRLADALHRYDETLELMAGEPETLVHGAYRPYNILVRAAGEAEAICVTDWEEAARGVPLYDLAYLSDGFEPARLHRLIEAYEDGLGGPGPPACDRDAALRRLDALYVHRNLKTLSKAASRDGFSAKGIQRLVTRIEALMRGLS
jgi:hypothetical protein